MYSYLKGKLAQKTPMQVVVDIGGIGYELSIPLSTYSILPDQESDICLLTHVYIREDAHQIFGFATNEERNLFRLLITISGIGPKLGLAILSGLDLNDLKQAIIEGNLGILTSISGVGRKTAERIVIELREKVVVEERSSAAGAGASTFGGGPLIEDTVSVLVSLGYKKQASQDAVKKALESQGAADQTVEKLVRSALKTI